jgi:hypothetical protein
MKNNIVYCCDCCNYKVKSKTDFAKHLTTDKHLKNFETFTDLEKKIKLCCVFCGKIFDTEEEKLLHFNECEKNKQTIEIKQLKNEIDELKKKLITQNNENNTLKKKIKKINNQNINHIEEIKNDHTTQIEEIKNQHTTQIEEIKNQHTTQIEQIKNQHTLQIEEIKNQHITQIEEINNEHVLQIGEVYKTSNKTLETIAKLAIKEIRQKYPDAPLLERMNNEIVNQIMNDLFRKGDDDYKMCSRILFFYKDKQLVNLISEAILSYYTKLDPKDQAFWNTDTARLNYIIKDTVDNKESWVIDKFGVKMKNLVISPLGDELRNYIFEHKNVLCKNSLDRNNNSRTIQKLQEEINICFDIIFFIDEKKFEYSICKTMAPKMYYNGNVSTKAIENG